MPSKLPPSVLLALGLTTSCDRCSQPHLGPCLSIEIEEPEEPEEVHIGPCLKYAPEPVDTGLGPCLEYPPELEEEEPDPGGEQGALSPGSVRERVLARGVLPEDVAALLRKRQG
jgi:hypothetical protein